MRTGRPPTAPILRFQAKVLVLATGCWAWQGTRINGAYGQFWDGKRQVYAHRWAYEQFVGPIPDGHQVDHLCRVPPCVNPAHLEAVTPQINTLRSSGPPALNAVKTHCDNGHEFDSGNTVYTRHGRKCRTCRNEIHRQYRLRKKAS